MRTAWFTFGWGQAHHVQGHTFDPNIVEITAEDPRAVMTQLFGREWSMEYSERPDDRWIPRGVMVYTERGGFITEAERDEGRT